MKIRKYIGIAKTIALGAIFMLAGITAQSQTLADAKKQIEKHHFQKAMSALQTIIRNEPANAAAYYELGGIYLENRILDSARHFYERGISVNAGEPLSYVGMGRFYLENNDRTRAKEQFQKAISLAGPKNAYVMQQVADAYVDGIVTDEGKWAAELAGKAANLDRKNLSYMITLGDAYRLVPGETVKGLEQYRAAVAMDKNYAPAYFRQAQLYYKLRNTAEGDKFIRQAMTADPAFAPVYVELAEQAFDSRKPGNDTAIGYYKKYLDLAGFAPRARIILGSYYFSDKKYPEAVAELKKAGEYDPNAVLVMRLNAYSNYFLKNYKEAEAGFEKYFFTVKPEYIIGQDYMHYGFLFAATGRDSMAVANYLKVLETDSNVYAIYDTLANTYERQKKYLDAAAIIEAKLKRQQAKGHPVNPQDYYTAGKNYYYAGDYAKADTNLAQVNEDYPTWIGGFKFRATINLKLDPKSEQGLARPFWAKVIELGQADPVANKRDLTDAYNYMAESHYNAKEYGLVKCYSNKMLQLDAANERAKKLLSYLPKETKEECPEMK